MVWYRNDNHTTYDLKPYAWTWAFQQSSCLITFTRQTFRLHWPRSFFQLEKPSAAKRALLSHNTISLLVDHMICIRLCDSWPMHKMFIIHFTEIDIHFRCGPENRKLKLNSEKKIEGKNYRHVVDAGSWINISKWSLSLSMPTMLSILSILSILIR